MECSQLKRNRRTEGDATNDSLIDFQVIEKMTLLRIESYLSNAFK